MPEQIVFFLFVHAERAFGNISLNKDEWIECCKNVCFGELGIQSLRFFGITF
ncbi:hypothetical protein ABIB39_004730 [Mucilaginibacter sp. UYP27]